MSILPDQHSEAEHTGPATPTAGEPGRPHHKNKKRKTRRRIAKALAWLSLVVTAAFVLAEPWLLLPVITFVIALSLWD